MKSDDEILHELFPNSSEEEKQKLKNTTAFAVRKLSEAFSQFGISLKQTLKENYFKKCK